MKKQSTEIETATMADLCKGDEHFWPNADLFHTGNGDDRGTYRTFINDIRGWNMTPEEVKQELIAMNEAPIGGNE